MASRVARLLGRSARWAGCRLLHGGVILGYHRVATVAADPWHMAVRPEHFAQHLEVLVRRTRPVSLQQLSETAQPARDHVAITFDDAYLDVMEAALPVLERFEVPATVFVISGALGKTFWWDRLVALYGAASPAVVNLTLPATGPRGHVQTLSVDSRKPIPAALHEVLSSSPEPMRRQLLDDLASGFGVTGAFDAEAGCRSVTRTELLQLLQHPLIQIGAHTHSHPDLSRVDPDRLEPEIGGSRESLGTMLGRDVTAFAYPHGGITPAARTAVARAGFTVACAGYPGRVRGGSNRLSLPRLWPTDVNGEGFAKFLRAWTGL